MRRALRFILTGALSVGVALGAGAVLFLFTGILFALCGSPASLRFWFAAPIFPAALLAGGYAAAAQRIACGGRWAVPLAWALLLLYLATDHFSTTRIHVPDIPPGPLLLATIGPLLSGFVGGDLGDRKRKIWEHMIEDLHQRVDHGIHQEIADIDTERRQPPR